MKTVTSILIALVVPLGWGLLSAWAFDRLRIRRQESCLDDPAAEEPSA